VEESSSDSCPSVDNFNVKELQKCFKAVINDADKNPFAQSIVDVAELKKSDSYTSGA
jgi:hypothetical protein